MGLLDPFPLWMILPLTVVLAVLSIELGYRLARYRLQRDELEKQRSPMTSIYVQSLNEMIDLHATRLMALRARVPAVIWIVLYLLGFLAWC